jgi:N-ethylmaleimide reductase
MNTSRRAPQPARARPHLAETSMTVPTLFSSYSLGPITLKNRAVMAPMTRSRAIGNVPNALMARYYAQRAEAGLIVTEGTSPAVDGLGYARIPGLFSDAQVEGWRLVTDAVHREGGRIFVQLMHTGRVTHPGNLPSGGRVLAPSAVAYAGKMYVDGQGELPLPVPEAMSAADIERAIEGFAQAGERAIRAGFDGVELHGANGYLINQFLDRGANQRTDEWGGSLENRIRFPLAVAERVAARIGAERLGIRVSPYGAFNGMVSDDPATEELHESLARGLSQLGLAYIHIVDHQSLGAPEVKPSVKRKIREAFRGTVILSGGYDLARANADLAEGRGDLVAFGRPFLANPRLLSRLRNGSSLVAPDFATFYTPGEKGYADYAVEA